MSLVAYASSEEESDAEEAAGEEEAAAPLPDAEQQQQQQQPQARGLFAALPPPKAPALSPQPLGSSFPLLPPPPPFLMAPPAAIGASSGEQQPRPSGLLLPPPGSAAPALLPPRSASASAALPGAGVDLRLPKPKKRTEPVRIAAPELPEGDSDSEEDEPAKKKNSAQGSGLAALLPQPKNLVVKEPNRLLLPHSFSRKSGETSWESKPGKAPGSSSRPKTLPKGSVPTTPSPSAIKAAAKSAALQVTKQMTQEEEEEESDQEELEHENFFSLSDRTQPLGGAEAFGYPSLGSEDPPPGTEPQFQDPAANAPLEFRTGAGCSGAQQGWVPKPGEDHGTYGHFPAYGEPGGYYQDYYSTEYYQEVDPAQAAPPETTPDSSFIDDEAFKRLQGKRNRGREEINFVDIKGDDQLSGAQQWLTKSLTEEKTMKSFSKKKGDQPTGQQRRKHQITYLIHQAKERELELKNTWSENKMSRRQTQANLFVSILFKIKCYLDPPGWEEEPSLPSLHSLK
ncbi:proline-rich protein PRCC isoform X2 [Heliangelus exortis]|uniref:proline-rich protein PRCC isoform X2 n=1 Tax=Heliangelus exortis TaxID=472823 RepID=UPI003A8CAE6B